MNYRVGDKAKLFKSDKTVTIKKIVGAQVDIYGTEADVYEVEEDYGIYVDIYDGTVARA